MTHKVDVSLNPNAINQSFEIIGPFLVTMNIEYRSSGCWVCVGGGGGSVYSNVNYGAVHGRAIIKPSF